MSFNTKSDLKNMSYLNNNCGKSDGVYTFPKIICSKINVITQLEFELTNYDVIDHLVSHNITVSPPRILKRKKEKKKERKKDIMK